MTTSSSSRRAATGLTGAGLLLAAGGLSHPRVEADAGYEEGLAGMFEAAAWNASHALTLAGFLVLAISAAALGRGLGSELAPRLRLAVWAVAGGAALAAVENVPHLLASSEGDALVRGDATPLTDVHAVLQAFATPAVGLSVAALALMSASRRSLGNGRIVAAVATAGGLAFALAGPLMAITKDPAISPLFAGSAGMAIWLVLAGARTARRLGSEDRVDVRNVVALER